MLENLINLYDRDLRRLETELSTFRQEENLWRVTGQIANPAGNLGLHLVGNLTTYIGKNLGGIDYIRDRPAEFSRRDVPLTELLAMVRTTHGHVISTLQQLKSDDLEARYPEDVLGFEMTKGYFLLHLLTHLAYHTGQINYIRRVLE
jgi:hypothetical protein